MRSLITIIIIFLSSTLFSQVKYYVSVNGNNSNSGLNANSSFLTIQFAINTSQSGDSIIVSPGTYQENINFSGKNIKVCSHYIYSSDTLDIVNTKIDGGANGFPVVRFISGENINAHLNGFTIQNGLVAQSLTGAGIHIHNWGTSPTLKNLIVKNNNLINQGEGAGITVFNTEAVTTINNVKILNNVSLSGVGGLKVHASNISMTNVEFRNNTGIISAFVRSIGAGSTDNFFYPLINILVANNNGSLCVSGSGLVFMNSTIFNNNGGIVLAGNSAILNSIVGSSHTITNQGILAIENSLIKDGESSIINPIAAMLTYQDNLSGSIFFNANNYKLQSYSPAIGFGQDQFQYFSQTYKSNLFDLENTLRDTIGNSSVDLGCYENSLNQALHNNKIYVSTTGTNNETVGLISNPFLSIQTAVDYSKDNDSIILLPGTYTENVICGKSVHFKSQNGSVNTIWQHNDLQNFLLTVFHPTWDHVNPKTPSVTGIKFIKNLNIINTNNVNTHALRAQQGARLIVNNCWFEDIRIATSTYYGWFNINNCVFYNIEILAFNDAGYTEVERLPQYNFCTIINSQLLTGGSPAIYPTFTNCIITKTTPIVSSYFQGTQPKFTKVFIDQTVNALTGSVYSVIQNILHLGFENIANKDFHLKNSSPAIGYSSVISGITTDFDGQTRPQFSFPDIGAFEHINNSPSNAAPFFDTPTNLTFLEDQPIVINLTGIDDGNFVQNQALSLSATSINQSIVVSPTVNYISNQSLGTISFIPLQNTNGVVPIILKIKDNGGTMNNGIDSLVYTLNVNILSVNDAPIANNDSIITNEDTPINISILSNDTDVDNSIVSSSVDLNLSLSGVQSTIITTNGTWSVNLLGILTFTPSLNFNGIETINYNIKDDSMSLSNVATIKVKVLPINDIPVALNDVAATNEDSPISLNVLSNDSDVDNLLDSSSVDLNINLSGIQNSISTSNGLWSVNNSGLLTFIPALNFNGTVTLDYNVKDATGLLSNTAMVTITVLAINDEPVAVNDTLTTSEDQSISYNLLINDYDVDNSLAPNTIDLNVINPGVQSANITSAGNWNVNAAGILTFTPAANYFGQAILNYSVKDASGLVSNIAQLVVNTSSINDAPVALNNTGLTIEDTQFTLDILSNDTDVDNLIDLTSVDFDFVTIGNQSNIINSAGTWSVNSTGLLTFIPSLNFNGNTTVSYTVADQLGLTSNIATITISVTAVNDAPIANNDTLTTSEDVSVSMNLILNDTDVDNSIANNTIDLDQSLVGVQNSFSGTNGTFNINSSGVLTFNPALNFNGTSLLTYTVKDISGSISNTATINIYVIAINDAPIAINDNTNTTEDNSISLNILINDSDVENQLDSSSIDLNLTLTGIQNAIQTPAGNWSISSGLLTYNPALNFNGVATIQYQLRDLQGFSSNVATVSVTVSSINDAPDSILISNSSIFENSFSTIGLFSTLDVDSNQLVTYTLVSGVGSINNSDFTIINNQLQNNSLFDYEQVNQYSIRVKSTDQGGLSTEHVFIIQVLNSNDIQVLDSISNTNCNGLTANGTINISPSQTNGTVSYNWTGPNLFTSNLQDISGLESGLYNLTIIDQFDTANFNFTVNQIPTYNDLSVCYVTGDTMPGNHNRIYFNNPAMYNVQYFQVLRESTVQGVFDFIGQANPQDTSFLDLVSNNQAQSFSYKVRVIDSCGNFSNESNAHTTILLQANLSASNSVNLSWTPYNGTGYTSYYLYRSINGGVFNLLATLPASQLSFNDITANVTNNQYLYFISIVVPNCDFTKANNIVRSNIKDLSNDVSDIQENYINNLFQLVPNPTSGLSTIVEQNDQTFYFYCVLDSNGQIIQSSTDKQIDLSNYSAGVYFLEITTIDGHKIQKKIIKI